MLRVVVREDFTRSRCESLIKDIKLCMQLLEKMDNDAVKRQQEYINKHHLHSSKSEHNHPQYKVCLDNTLVDRRLLDSTPLSQTLRSPIFPSRSTWEFLFR